MTDRPSYIPIPGPEEIAMIPLGGFVDDTSTDIRIRVSEYSGDMWDWCKQNLVTGTWKCMFPIIGIGTSYIFKNGTDALAFKLRFNIHE